MSINSMKGDCTWYSSAQAGAPSLTSVDPNGLLKVLDACLVDGWGEKQVLNASIDGELITFDFGVGHGCNLYQKIIVSGASDSLLNGIHKVVAATNNTVTISVVGVLLNTGTIKVKIAPLGYESIFGKEDTLKRAYRSLSANSSKKVLFLDMGYFNSEQYSSTIPARRAKVSVCEDMTELGTQINSLTDDINYPSGTIGNEGSLFWMQGRGSSKTISITSRNIDWVIVGNGEFFYFCLYGFEYVGASSGYKVRGFYAFGEYQPLGSDQANTTMLTCERVLNDVSTLYASQTGARFVLSQSIGTKVYSEGLSGKLTAYSAVPFSTDSASTTLTSGKCLAPYPSSRGNYLFTYPLMICDAGYSYFGYMPNALFIAHSMHGNNDLSIVDGVLIVAIGNNDESGTQPANLGFYVGV